MHNLNNIVISCIGGLLILTKMDGNTLASPVNVDTIKKYYA